MWDDNVTWLAIAHKHSASDMQLSNRWNYTLMTLNINRDKLLPLLKHIVWKYILI